MGEWKILKILEHCIYGNELVNTIATKLLCASWSSLADTLAMVRGRTLLILEVRGQGHMNIYGDKLVNTIETKLSSISSSNQQRSGLSICPIWADIRPHSQCKIVSFFPNLDPKFSQFDSLKKKWEKWRKNDKACNTSMTEYLISKGTLTIKGNKYMDNKICRFFSPILRKTPLFFPIPRAPGPQSQKGVQEPWRC